MASLEDFLRSTWGDGLRRHSSLDASGPVITKIGDDYMPSTALSTLAAFHNFRADVKIHRAMRMTMIGLALPIIDLDMDWAVPEVSSSSEAHHLFIDLTTMGLQILITSEQNKINLHQKALEERNEVQAHVATEMSRLDKNASIPCKERVAAKLRLKEMQMQSDAVLRQTAQEMRDATLAIKLIRLRLADSMMGPNLWFLTGDGRVSSKHYLLSLTIA